VADGVDASMDPVQATCPDPFAHGAVDQSEAPELGKRNDAVLARCELCNRPIPTGWLRFRPVWARFLGHP
jgi:hypothetical protein